jgi:hypothetical protein
VQDQQGKRLHDQQEADFCDVVDQSSVDIDIIVSGHMHVGQEGKLEGHGIPVTITGAPSQINKSSSDHSPSVWLVRIEKDSLGITRQLV